MNRHLRWLRRSAEIWSVRDPANVAAGGLPIWLPLAPISHPHNAINGDGAGKLTKGGVSPIFVG